MTAPQELSGFYPGQLACPVCAAPLSDEQSNAQNCPQCGCSLASVSAQVGETTLLGAAVGGHASGEPREEDQLVGQELDVYRIEQFLGRGAMGTVFLATHRDLGRRCSLKVLSPRLAKDDRDYIDRFLLEGRSTAALVHPNIVTVHALGEARGYYFLEMEYIPGRSLGRLLEDEGLLAPARATRMAACIAEGLALAHQRQVIHRDVKPDNVLVTLTGIPKLADFGLARRLTGQALQLPDGLCGTPFFMAPELFHGEPVSPASDVYALGVSYFCMLTGRLPYMGATLPHQVQLLRTQPVPQVRDFVPEVPLEMAECVALLLDKTPSNRPLSGYAAAQLLHSVLGESRDLETLVRDAFVHDRRVTWTAEQDQFRITVQLPRDRRQIVYLRESDLAAADRLVEISTTCCPAQQGFYESALRLNGDMPHGGIAVRECDGQLQFVVIDTYPRATIDAEEIRRSTHELAARADSIEHLLTGQDRH